jgi:signal transduction histidine kinase
MIVNQGRRQFISFRSASILAVVIVLVTVANAVFFQDNPELRTITSDLYTPAINFLATLCLVYAAYNSRNDKTISRAWAVLALAQLSFTIGDVIWAILEIGLHESPYPSLADGPYLAFYPLFALGILLLPKEPLTSSEKLKVFLDAGIVMIASVLLFWVLLIAPTIESNVQADALTSTLSVAYPVADLVLFFALIELLFRRIKSMQLVPVMLLIASTAFMIATDFVYMSKSLQGTYTSGGLMDTGWIIAYVLIGLAGVSQVNSKKTDLFTEANVSKNLQFTWPLYIPYIWAGATYVLLIWSYDHPMPVSFSALSWGVGGIIGLVVIRQVVALNENVRLYEGSVQENAERKLAEKEVRRLNEELENRVAERTAELEKANNELIIEIQERKKAEEALNSARDQLLAIIEFLPDATFVIDQNKRVIAWNQAMEEMTGIRKQDMLGKGDFAYGVPFYGGPRPILIDLIEKQDEAIESKYRQLVRTERSINAESYAPSLFSGRGAYVWGTASLLYDRGGQLVGSIESIRDITERKLADEAIHKARDELELRVKERTAELEAKNSEMERFIYTVSHDLRSPLVTIQGFNGFLKGDIEKGDSEKVKTDLRLIEEAVTKMDRLLSKTLELSRIGRVADPPEDVPFEEIAEEALLQTSQRIKSGGIDVSVAKDMPVVRVDKMRIVEAMVNLIENSIKYRGEQQHPRIEIGYQNEAEKTVFYVRDNGMGIDPSLHEKVFELFYKVNKNSDGTGAGLAIVKRIIDVHGGSIWIESELGKGTTVCFTLPVRSNI